MSREDTVFESGDVVADRYEIAEELGRGSYGVVYRAVQLGIGRDVALKTLLPQTPTDSVEHQRFEREAMVISRFNHPNIVTLHDYGEYDGVLFMVMEYIEGRPLREVIDQEAPLAPKRIRAITSQILDALQYAHDDNIVHRDLKPANIQLLSNPSIETDQDELVKVLDFGIAKIVHGDEDAGALDTLTQTGTAMGTPQYMSPENITGDPVKPHADLYAVGLLIYEMLAGQPAFGGDDPQDVMVAHIKDPPAPLPERDDVRQFQRAVDWSLRKQPADRIQSARQFRDILEEDAPTTESAPRPTVETDERSLIKPLAAVTAASSVVIALLVAMLVVGDTDSETGSPPIDEPEPADHQTAPDGQGDRSESPVDEADDEALQRAADTSGQAVEDGRGEALQEGADAGDPEQSADDDSGGEPPGDDVVGGGEVQLQIETDVDPARVTVDGEWAGMTPLSEELDRRDEPVVIEVRRDDYGAVVQEVVPDSDRRLEIELQ